jgi:tetratricopeptide (TPR) repeat protein|eukprot:g8174.t1
MATLAATNPAENGEVALLYGHEEDKRLGNEAFLTKDYKTAVEHYSNGIVKLQENPEETVPVNIKAIMHGNRSACYFELGQYEMAKQDADTSTKVDSKYFKGYWRSAQCADKLGDTMGSLSILSGALGMDKGLYGDSKHRKMFSNLRKLREQLRTHLEEVPIESYAFSDGRKKVSAYIDLPGISLLDKEDIVFECKEKSLDLKVYGLNGKCYRLFAPELWARVDPAKSKFKVKKEKEQLVLLLQKVSTEAIHSMWESLRRN